MRSVRVPIAFAITLAACAHSQPPPAPPAERAPQAVAEPPSPPPPAPVTPSPPASVDVVPASIYFDFDSADLKPEARSTLQAFFDQARQRPDLTTRIEGNCDERGSEEYNLALGQRRADSAKSYLVNLGIDASRISTISYGKEHPRAPGDDEAAWSQNRRDDLVPVTSAVGQASR
jgi:peptidoglycan-associated lipoprotein